MELQKFIKLCESRGAKCIFENEVLTIKTFRNLDLQKVKTLPEVKIVFNVKNWLNLPSLKEIKTDITFNVHWRLNLESLKEIKTDIIFNVGRFLYLKSLKEITTDITFKVGWTLFLDSLEKHPEWLNGFRIFDGIPGIVKSTRTTPNGLTVYHCHSVYNINNNEFVEDDERRWFYVAEHQNGLTAHGDTLKEAVGDLEFKLVQQKGLTELIVGIKERDVITPMEYRVLTGACEFGINAFLERKGLEGVESVSLKEALDLTEGEYGYEKFKKLLKS